MVPEATLPTAQREAFVAWREVRKLGHGDGIELVGWIDDASTGKQKRFHAGENRVQSSKFKVQSSN